MKINREILCDYWLIFDMIYFIDSILFAFHMVSVQCNVYLKISVTIILFSEYEMSQ